ncbi:MAG: MBOAT family protein [Oscillospiraceae bacterium]|nr:MBOAT family protein [Oscillospiraceae bacterium]MBR0450911.1 MBOAT family protein [Oscillospiraceae bacterium]
MSFSSFVFLIRFLPLALILYYIVPGKVKNPLLVVLSLVFYTWGDPRSLPALLVIALAGYVSALMLDKLQKGRKAVLIFGLLLVLGSLAFYKYLGFIVSNLNSLIFERLNMGISAPKIASPLGISFFAFTTASYIIDVYKGVSSSCRNIVDYLLYICFFPKLLMGPIMRYKDFEPQLHERVIFESQLEKGAFRFIKGLAKKVLLADSVSALWNEVTSLGYENVSTPFAWLGVLAYTLQLYYDFSGYSDMALGLASMLGFTLPENFNFPYSSKSATEFWRRWHMTMGEWFKQYVYFPLGGSRCSKSRMMFNTFVVWALTGLWHGAAWNFVLWGIFYFILLMLEKNFYLNYLNKYPILGHIYTIFVTLVGWALFAVSDFGSLFALLKKMFVFSGGYSCLYSLRNYGILLIVCAVFSLEKTGRIVNRLSSKLWFRLVAALVLLLLSLAYMTDATYQPFLYAQF